MLKINTGSVTTYAAIQTKLFSGNTLWQENRKLQFSHITNAWLRRRKVKLQLRFVAWKHLVHYDDMCNQYSWANKILLRPYFTLKTPGTGPLCYQMFTVLSKSRGGLTWWPLETKASIQFKWAYIFQNVTLLLLTEYRHSMTGNP